MADMQLTTVRGYDAPEVVSALIKAIRIADDQAAVYWAVELGRSSFGAWLWKRLRIAVSEEVGLAEPGLASEIDALHRTYVDLRKNKADRQKPWRLQVVHAALLLARSPKSRLVDWTLMAAYSDTAEHREVPDVALDKHTRRGRALGRGWDHFFEQGTVLEPHAEQPPTKRKPSNGRTAVTSGHAVDDATVDEPPTLFEPQRARSPLLTAGQ